MGGGESGGWGAGVMARGELNPLMVTDDRGDAHRVPWARRERRPACFGAALQKEIERREMAHRRFFGLKNTTVIAIGVGFIVMLFLFKLLPIGWPSEGSVGAVVLTLITFGIVPILAVGIAGRPKSIVIDTLREHARCPACVYNLAGCPVAADDGCTVCPECGAAWRLDIAASGEDGASKVEGPERL